MKRVASTWRKQFSNDCGTAAVEATLALPVLFLTILMGMNYMLGVYRMIAIEHLLGSNMRQAILNADGTDAVGTIKSRVQSVGEIYGVALSDENIRVCLAEDGACLEREIDSVEQIAESERYTSIKVWKAVNLFGPEISVDYSFTVFGRME